MSAGSAVYDSLFRRADPVQRGRIAPDAFYEHFGDGVTSMRELENIFNIVDEDGDGWIEPEELQPFLMGGDGEVHELFSRIGDMNRAAMRCVGDMRRNYRRSGRVGQFRTRLGLREAARQLKELAAALVETHDQMAESVAQDSRRKDAARQLTREYVGDIDRRRADVGAGEAGPSEGDGRVAAELQQVRDELALLWQEVRSQRARPQASGDTARAFAAGRRVDEGEDYGEDYGEDEDEDEDEDEAAVNEHVDRPRAVETPAGEAVGLGEDYGENFGDEGDVDEEEANTADGPTLLAVIAEASRRGDLPQRGRGYLKQALLTERLSGRARRALIRYAKTGDRDALVDAMTM